MRRSRKRRHKEEEDGMEERTDRRRQGRPRSEEQSPLLLSNTFISSYRSMRNIMITI